MDWRILTFIVCRRAREYPARLAALLLLTVALSGAGAGVWAARQPVTLTVAVPARYLAAGVALHVAVAEGGRPVAGDDLEGEGQSPAATFRLPRGEYTVQLSVFDANGVALLLARPVPIHLAGDRVLGVGEGPEETLVWPLFPPAPPGSETTGRRAGPLPHPAPLQLPAW